jgi:hypothetical protein
MLGEKLQKMGMLGCLLCIVGSTEIVLHAPQEKSINSVQEIWLLAVQPGMLLKDFAGFFFVFFFLNWFFTELLYYTGFCFCFQHFSCTQPRQLL